MLILDSYTPELRAVIKAFEDQGAPVTGSGDNLSAPCPNHEDSTPSLSIADGNTGVILKCHAGCDQDELFQAVVDFTGLKKTDFFYKKSKTNVATAGPVATVAALAAAKKLPLTFLTHFGIRDSPRGIEIPYWDVAAPPRIRIRSALKASDGSVWQKLTPQKTKLTAYGAWCVEQFRPGATLYFVEGETDTLTGWYYGLPVIGFPGKGTARRILQDNKHLITGIQHVFVVEEPDDFRKRVFLNGVRRGLSDIHWPGHVYSMRLPEKDLSDLHVKRGPDGFGAGLAEAFQSAVDAPNWPDPGPVPPSAAKTCAAVLGPGFPPVFGVRDVQRRMRSKSSEDLRHDLELLEDAKVVRRLPQLRVVGRPALRYRVNPKAHSG